MKDCNSISTLSELGLKLTKIGSGKMVDATLYEQIVASLMYLTTTRTNMMHDVSFISIYMENILKFIY